MNEDSNIHDDYVKLFDTEDDIEDAFEGDTSFEAIFFGEDSSEKKELVDFYIPAIGRGY